MTNGNQKPNRYARAIAAGIANGFAYAVAVTLRSPLVVSPMMYAVNLRTTPLHAAAQKGDLAFVTALLKQGEDPNARTNSGETPLHFAASGKSGEVICALIDGGANVNAKNESGDTPLHFAADNRYQKNVSLLISKGANSCAKSNDGHTPFHAAAESNNPDAISALSDANSACVNEINALNRTPLDIAMEKEHTECIRLLKKIGGKTSAELRAEEAKSP